MFASINKQESKDPRGKEIALFIGDTVVVNDSAPATILTYSKKRIKNIAIFLKVWSPSPYLTFSTSHIYNLCYTIFNSCLIYSPWERPHFCIIVKPVIAVFVFIERDHLKVNRPTKNVSGRRRRECGRREGKFFAGLEEFRPQRQAIGRNRSQTEDRWTSSGGRIVNNLECHGSVLLSTAIHAKRWIVGFWQVWERFSYIRLKVVNYHEPHVGKIIRLKIEYT